MSEFSEFQSDSGSPLLNESEAEALSEKRTPANNLNWWKLFMLSLALIAITVPMAVFLSTPRVLERGPITDCGSTNEEAISRGCFMEPMLYGWVPPACYFANLSSQYQPFTDRDWYSDPHFASDSKIAPEDIWAGKHVHIFVHRYHIEHCLFLWRKLAWAVEAKSEWLDTKTLAVSHADHCAKQLSRQWESENGTNDVELGFYHCVRLLRE